MVPESPRQVAPPGEDGGVPAAPAAGLPADAAAVGPDGAARPLDRHLHVRTEPDADAARLPGAAADAVPQLPDAAGLADAAARPAGAGDAPSAGHRGAHPRQPIALGSCPDTPRERLDHPETAPNVAPLWAGWAVVFKAKSAPLRFVSCFDLSAKVTSRYHMLCDGRGAVWECEFGC